MSKRDCTECVTCFYCDQVLAGRHEHDHFPMPKTAGGEMTVPACLGCHELKDRTSLIDMPLDEVFETFKELTPRGRILLAKAYASMYHQREHDRRMREKS